MRKDELVYLHALCARLRRQVETDSDVPDPTLDGYEREGVSPTAVHRCKATHQEAVFRLLDGITESVEPAVDSEDASGSHRGTHVEGE